MVVKKYLAIFSVFLLCGGIMFLMFGNISLTGETIVNDYTFTKAVCDENNFCQDYEIRCNGEQVVSQTPIQGASVQYPKDWKDPRTKEERERLCK